MAIRLSNTETDDLYELLQVSTRADPEVIEAAYRVLARRFHPDINRSPNATEMMARVNAAWETLRDPARRTAYDAERARPPVPALRSVQRSTPAARESEREPAQSGPLLSVEPGRISAGRMRRGRRRVFSVHVHTQPAGIRVHAAVAGGAWLTVSPAVLERLDQNMVTIDVQTRGLRLGVNRGAVEISTSWETHVLPVEVNVTPAPLPYRLAAGLRRVVGSPLVMTVTVLVLLLALLLLIALR